MNGQADHLHLLLGLHAKCAPSVLVNNFQTVTSRRIQKEFTVLRDRYRQPVLWSKGYFVATAGGAPLALIKQYLEQQARPSPEEIWPRRSQRRLTTIQAARLCPNGATRQAG